jgi:hypothetical protein
MKQETNNEMDLLLRRLSRRPDISVTNGNGDVDHLDADELSAYAENVVPAAARARYTEHLAECTRCRELVVQLSSAAGVAPVVQTTRALGPSGLRKFLASLFSPIVLRYAVPALGLILVAALGVFVLRQKKSEDGGSIAQNVEAPTPTSITTPSSPEPVQPARGIIDQSKEQAAAGKPAQSSGSPSNQPAAAAPEAPATTGAVADTSRETSAKQEETQSVVAEAPKPVTTSDEYKRSAEAEARKEPSPNRYANEPPAEKTVNAAKVEDRKKADAEIAQARADSSADKADKVQSFGVATVQGGAIAKRSRGQRDDDEVEKDKNDAGETKTVAGRKFRKRGGIWIDTVYSAPRVTTNLTRNSEQYRALIADEPGIKTIADELDGEVIVVWKGRAYHIR